MSSVEIFMVVASMLGGLALFLFGMNTLSGSLSSMTGGLLDRVLGKITKSAFMGFLFGAGLTAIVQSSSAITVLSVGLVNSGIIGLKQAASLIIGANLGTTATAWVISAGIKAIISYSDKVPIDTHFPALYNGNVKNVNRIRTNGVMCMLVL